MTPRDRVLSAAGRLKVFPLPQAVLFPGAALPLHIFEPRYRELVRDALATDQVFAMARPLAAPAGGPPPLEPVVSAGVIAQHEVLPDGRYNLVLSGVMRCRVVRELPQTHLYREVEAVALPDEHYAGPLSLHLRNAVLQLSTHLPDEVASWVGQVAAAKEGGELADLVASAVVAEARRRGRVLDELRVPERLSLVLEDVGGLLARMGGGGEEGGFKN